MISLINKILIKDTKSCKSRIVKDLILADKLKLPTVITISYDIKMKYGMVGDLTLTNENGKQINLKPHNIETALESMDYSEVRASEW